MEKFIYNSPIGRLYIGVLDNAIVRLQLNDFDAAFVKKSAYKPVIGKICSFLDGYFDGKPSQIDFDILPSGTEFQLKVFKELLKIPYGKTASYKQIADKVFTGKKCPQAVGGAVGKNPIMIIIPCHRILGADKSLVGFSASLDVKRKLLIREGIDFKE